MTKPVKAILWAVTGIVSVCLVLAALAVNVVFSKDKLTPIVQKQIPNYITCDAKVGGVELTFFSTFPHFAINLNDVLLINPQDCFQNDTLLQVKKLQAFIDVSEYLNHNKIDIKGICLQDGIANLFESKDHIRNFDVLVQDKEDKDDSAFSFGEIDFKDVKFESLSFLYDNRADSILLRLKDVSANISGETNLLGLSGNITTDLNMASFLFRDSTSNVMLQDISVPECNLIVKDSTNLCVQLSTSVQKSSLKVNDGSIINLSTGKVDLAKILISIDKDAITDLDIKVGLDTVMLSIPEADGLHLQLSHADFTLPRVTSEEVLEASYETSIANAFLKNRSSGILLNNLPLSAAGQIKISADKNELSLKDTKLTFADEKVFVNAEISRIDSTIMQISSDCSLAPTTFDNLLALVPSAIKKEIKDINVKGKLNKVFSKASITIEKDKPIVIDDLEVISELQNLKFNQGNTLATSANALAFELRYPVENAKMSSQKREQQLKRQKATNNKRRSRHANESNFMHAKLSGEMLHFEQHDSSDVVADLPHTTFSVSLSDEILSDSLSLPFIAANFNIDRLKAKADTISLDAHDINGSFTMADGMRGMKKYYEANFESNDVDIQMGRELSVVSGPLSIEASSVYDHEQKDLLLRYNPLLNVTMSDGLIKSATLPYAFEVPTVDFDFNLGKFQIRSGKLNYGDSDFSLTGEVNNLREYLKKEADLKANLSLNSRQTHVYQLMDMVELLAGPTDSTATTSDAENYINATLQDHQSKEVSMSDPHGGNPFIVPQAIDLTLTTDIDKTIVGENEFVNLGGKLFIKDGNLVLEEMGFSSQAARMQLTALYRSPQKNNLFVGANFHLLDIEIEHLIKLIPEIDSLAPMLRSFGGKAEFHLAAETNLFGNYDIKMSTLKATGAINGKDLILMDGETFSTISKYLMFNKKTENRIDTLSVEMALNQKKMVLYPMLVGMDKYQAVISGDHDLTGDMPFSYHISITDCPLVGGHVGLNIDGDIKNLESYKFKLVGCKYANLYKPEKRNITQGQVLELKSLIGNALKRTVKEQ